jgi:hypothetical protein
MRFSPIDYIIIFMVSVAMFPRFAHNLMLFFCRIHPEIASGQPDTRLPSWLSRYVSTNAYSCSPQIMDTTTLSFKTRFNIILIRRSWVVGSPTCCFGGSELGHVATEICWLWFPSVPQDVHYTNLQQAQTVPLAFIDSTMNKILP